MDRAFFIRGGAAITATTRMTNAAQPILIVSVHNDCIIGSLNHCIISMLILISSSLISAAHPLPRFSAAFHYLPISCTFPTSYKAGVFGSTKVR